MTDIGKSIWSWRIFRELTQQELAKGAGFARNMLGVYERNESSPSVERYERIADALGVSIPELVRGPKALADEVRTVPLPWHNLRTAIAPYLVPYLEDWNGSWSEYSEHRRAPWWPVSRELAYGPRCLVTRVTEDAMAPELRAGDAVVMSSRFERLRSGSLVMAQLGRTVCPRRLRIRRGKRLLEAADPSVQVVPVSSRRKVVGKIIGVVERGFSS